MQKETSMCFATANEQWGSRRSSRVLEEELDEHNLIQLHFHALQ